jgi:hypothetical protein
MTMMRKRGNQALVQQIRDLARAGNWQEAKKLADTLPSTPDNIRLKEKIEKQLYITTGEIPAVMEGSMALADDEIDEALLEISPPVTRALKKNRANELAPNIGNAVMQFLSAIALFWGVITFFTALMFPGRYSLYDSSAVQVTQVYSEATFLMVQAIALFVFGGVLQVAVLVRSSQWLKRNEG